MIFEVKKGKKGGMRMKISQIHRLIELGRACRATDSECHILQKRT